MFEKILVAIDGSPHAARALGAAAELAKVHGARLEILHVLGHGDVPEGLARYVETEHLVERRPSSAADAVHLSSDVVPVRSADDLEHAYRLRVAVGERLIEEARSEARRAGVTDVHGQTSEGEPARVILDRAASVGADLVVMGTRGLSELKGLLLGSVSHKVLQLAECPCLTIK